LLKKINKLFGRLQLNKLRKIRRFYRYRGHLSYWGRYYFRKRLQVEERAHYEENIADILFNKLDLFEQRQALVEEQYFDLLSTNVTYYVHKLKKFE
jgi:hypothetical protein